MKKEPTHYFEYFCFEDDKIWNQIIENIIEFALRELKNIFDEEFNVIHSAVSRNAISLSSN